MQKENVMIWELVFPTLFFLGDLIRPAVMCKILKGSIFGMAIFIFTQIMLVLMGAIIEDMPQWMAM